MKDTIRPSAAEYFNILYNAETKRKHPAVSLPFIIVSSLFGTWTDDDLAKLSGQAR